MDNHQECSVPNLTWNSNVLIYSLLKFVHHVWTSVSRLYPKVSYVSLFTQNHTSMWFSLCLFCYDGKHASNRNSQISAFQESGFMLVGTICLVPVPCCIGKGSHNSTDALNDHFAPINHYFSMHFCSVDFAAHRKERGDV